MTMTVVQISYLVNRNFYALKVTSDGKMFYVYLEGNMLAAFDTAQAAVAHGMEYVENQGGE